MNCRKLVLIHAKTKKDYWCEKLFHYNFLFGLHLPQRITDDLITTLQIPSLSASEALVIAQYTIQTLLEF